MAIFNGFKSPQQLQNKKPAISMVAGFFVGISTLCNALAAGGLLPFCAVLFRFVSKTGQNSK